MIEIIYDIEWDKNFWCETKYIENIIANLEKKLDRNQNYSIVITTNLKQLPISKYNKIVIVAGDELGRLGLHPYINECILGVFRIFNRSIRCNYKGIYPIPPGYNWAMHNSDKKMIKMYPDKPLSERKYDIFYSGQVLPNRRTLMSKMGSLMSKFNVNYNHNKSFRIGLDIDNYYKTLGDTKIALCPDGTSVDTFRYVEALGSGCIVITTNKDDLWYYKNSPVFFLNSWDELNVNLIENILNSDLDKIYLDNLKYYKETLSEEAVSEYIIKTIP